MSWWCKFSRQRTKGHFTLLFCRGRERNAPRIIMHVHSHCTLTQKIWKFRMECCGFTSRNLYVCVKTFLSFLHQFDRAFVSQGRCIGLCLLCSIWHHINQIQLLTCKSVDFFCHCLALFRRGNGFNPP